jgi:hypothetical protein
MMQERPSEIVLGLVPGRTGTGETLQGGAMASRSAAINESGNANDVPSVVIAARGLPKLVVIDEPLKGGVLASIHLGAPEPLSRFAVVSRHSLDDKLILKIISTYFDYEVQHVDDVGPITLTLLVDGRIERASERYGHKSEKRTSEYGSRSSDPLEMTRAYLAAAAARPYEDVPGVGRARVIDLDENASGSR